MEHIVTGCSDCCFCKYASDYEEHECCHPEREDKPINFVYVDMSPGTCPIWCPLIEEPITISKQ